VARAVGQSDAVGSPDGADGATTPDPSSPFWPSDGTLSEQRAWTRGTLAILTWPSGFPGHGWQERWIASGADGGTSRLNDRSRTAGTDVVEPPGPHIRASFASA
jgi:hypothetical protein